MTLDLVAVGDSVVDIVIPIPRFLKGNEDSLHSEGMESHMGGSSNYLITASRLGLRVGIEDCVGDDDLGAFYLSGLEAEGVDASRIIVRRGGKTSSCVVILTKEGEHAYIGIEGVSRTFTPQELDEDYLLTARSFFMSGYPLSEIPIADTVLKAMRVARIAGRHIFFDPSPVADEINVDALCEAIKSTDTLILNDREMSLVATSLGVKPEPDSLIKFGAKRVVLKRGVDGCSFYTSSSKNDYPGFTVRVVDTTGAGDSFDAAIVYGTLRGWAERDTAILANVVGAVKVGKKAAGRNVPTLAEVREFIEKRGVSLATLL
jgi:sugar/nucleoside kinase (ribokinase family)